MATKKAAKKTRGPLVSYKDVQVTFLTHGDSAAAVAAVQALKPHVRTVKKAIGELAKIGKDGSALQVLVPVTKQGPKAPQAGEEREYTAQKVGTAGAFLRAPIEPLGVAKGTKVRVIFGADEIRIVRADAVKKGRKAAA